MAKLYFRYGAMGSSKTANALMVQFNYTEKGMVVHMLKPSIENRDGENIIKSRIGLSAECQSAEEYLKTLSENNYVYVNGNKPDAIIVDEVQYLDTIYIRKLAKIVDTLNIPVICYGLRTDFLGQLFPGSKTLMELADVIEQIPTICWCGHKAQFNARIDENGNIIRKGERIVLGSNNKYIPLCRKHFFEGKTFKE